MTKTLKTTLKEIQILLGKPKQKLAGALKYYLSFLQEPPEKEFPALPKKEKFQTIHHKKITWVDISNPSRRIISQLAQQYPFHPLHLEDCISRGQFPKIEHNVEDKYLFMLLRFPRFYDDRIIINQICFFLGKNYLVSVHEDGNDTISSIFKQCQESKQDKEAHIDNSSSHLLYTIIDQLTKELTSPLQIILKEVDEAEDIVFDDKVSAVIKIGQLRQRIITLRRIIGPLRALLSDIEEKVTKFSSDNLKVYFENITDRVNKTWDTLEEARETVEIYKDADFTFSTEKTNKILSVLTIIFTMTIPATVIGTLYGMNISLPGGTEAGNWTFWGKYTTMIVIFLLIAFPALLMVIYFRKKGWF